MRGRRGVGGGGLFAWEEELVEEFKLLFHGVTLHVDKVDRWLWNL